VAHQKVAAKFRDNTNSDEDEVHDFQIADTQFPVSQLQRGLKVVELRFLRRSLIRIAQRG
jgi:hypothetical protein